MPKVAITSSYNEGTSGLTERSGSTQTDDAAISESSPSTLRGRRLAGAAMVVMLFFVLSRVAGLAREVVIGARFGTSPELDAYLAAFRVPDILFQLIAGGALGSAFIPTFAAYWTQDKRVEAWLLFSRVLNLVILILVVVAGVVILFAQPLVEWIIAPGFTVEQQVLTARLMRWMLLSTVVFGASGLVMGALNAVQHFLLPAAAPVFYNLAIILGALFLAPTMGIDGLVIGVIAGAAAHFFVQLPGLRRAGATYRPQLSLADPGVREVIRLMSPRVLGLFFVQMHFLVNTILASGLAVGSLSALNYAWLLMLLPQGIFAQSIATAIFPTFASQVAAGELNSMQRIFGQIIRMIFFLTIPAAVGLYLLRIPLITILLERGEFTTESTELVAFALQFYAIGLVAHGVVEIVVRAFYALHDTWTPVLVGIGAMVLNILFSLWWVHTLQHGGLALANSVATTIEMGLLLWLLRRRLGGLEGTRLLQAVGRHLTAAILMGALLWSWLRWLETQTAWGAAGDWLAAGSGIVLAALVYGLSCLVLRSDELQPFHAVLLRKIR